MPQKITLQCTFSEELRASYNLGSLFHGLLMEQLTEFNASLLHESQNRPFSQYIFQVSENTLEWRIGLGYGEVSDVIARAIMPLTDIFLKHKNLNLKVINARREIIAERDYFLQFFNENPPCRLYLIEFLTPCTHKSAGKYVLFPTVELILQSLQMKFSSFISEFSLEDDKAMAQLVENIQIVWYSLHSVPFHLEGVKIAGYMGRMKLAIHGPEQLARLAGMILSLAEYSGIGIKTSLGMGACKITPIPVKKQAD